MKKTLARLGVALMALSSVGLASIPAQASTFDVSGIELDFSNSSPILENSAVNDTYKYTNVATVSGTQIDAIVTVTSATRSLQVAENFLYVSAADATSAGAPWTQGCYWTAAYDLDQSVTLIPATDKLSESIVDTIDLVESGALNKSINSELNICAGYTDPQSGSFGVKIEFVTGAGATPVTLTHVTLSGLDIDGGQYVKFSNPKPSNAHTITGTELTVDDAGSSTTFNSTSSSDETQDQRKWVGVASYDSVSGLEYEFGSTDDSGGTSHLTMTFKSALDDLADTGSTATSTVVLAGATFAVGALMILAVFFKRRRNA